MGFWAKSVVIYNCIRQHGKLSIRRLARHTGFSTSSVHRLEQARKRRDHHPESWFWETQEGRSWLIRLVVATLYHFGLKRGVGAETLREFFVRLGLETQLGCSPNTLRELMEKIVQAIDETTVGWEAEGIAHGEVRPLIGAVDETFLEQMMLVFMDLFSGYLVVEEVAPNRSYDTWYDLVAARLKTLGVGVRYLVSDRAKALIKLAKTGLECPSIPDFFPLVHELVTSYSLAIWRQKRQAFQALGQAREHRKESQNIDPSGVATQQVQAVVAAREADVERWEGVHRTYRGHLETLSLCLHPWRLLASTPQNSADVEGQLQGEIEAIETLMERHGLPLKKKSLEKVRKQLADLSALVDLWWQGVWQDVEHVALSPRWKHWIAHRLLPLLYWHHQVAHCRCPRRKAKLQAALAAVQAAFDTHPVTTQLAAEVLEGWKRWAAEHAQAFQRTSSAVEGRNGSLSQRHHNQRGLPKRRYRVGSALHNFDCRAPDGSTPASRLFRRDFPDLFETVLGTIEELPRPRKRKPAMALSD